MVLDATQAQFRNENELGSAILRRFHSSRMRSVTCFLLGVAAVLDAGVMAAADPGGPFAPWGVHLAYGPDPTTQMGVMWSTRLQVGTSFASVGNSAINMTTVFSGTQSMFTDVNNTQYIHHVLMSGLSPGVLYYYYVHDGAGNKSSMFHFTTATPVVSEPVVFAIFGDMGIDVNAHETLPLLTADVLSGAVDVILHVGDIAYDLDSNNGANGDTFMNNAQAYAAYAPVHLCPGNHESANDFFQYINRFNMMPPSANATGDGSYHSFNVGLTHVIMFSSEAYFYVSAHGLLMMPTQYAWLEADLAAVNRAVTPWVITNAHRPMYCSPNDDNDDCHSLTSIIRDGILGAYGLEVLLYKYGVDVHFGAHEHSYERNYPVYAYLWNSSVTGAAAYEDYDRPIHILTGAAGCPENQDPWGAGPNPFSAIRLNVYGYGRFHVVNTSYALWEFIDDSTGIVVDSMWFIRHVHGPYGGELDLVSQEVKDAAFAAAVEATRAGIPAPGSEAQRHASRDAHGKKHRRNHDATHVHDPAKYTHQIPEDLLRRMAERK